MYHKANWNYVVFIMMKMSYYAMAQHYDKNGVKSYLLG